MPVGSRESKKQPAKDEELSALRPIETDASTFGRALETQSTFGRALETQRCLARVGGLHPRSVEIADLEVAAAAEEAGATVLRSDADQDRIAAIAGQAVPWIAPPGSL
ncbi:MAG: hypothetical protein MI919_39760 [Holophagales bacterium]|nr:hypothetical protein [Holophagales bacterium]